MEDQNKPGVSAQTRKDKDALDERESDATSDQTVSDIPKPENDSIAEIPSRDSGPSPDGLLDEPGELNDAGPM